MKTKTMLVFALLFVSAQSIASNLRVYHGHISKNASGWSVTSAPNTTAPTYQIQWAKGEEPKQICLSTAKKACGKYWMSFTGISQQGHDMTFKEVQLVPPPEVLRARMDLRAELFGNKRKN